MQTKASDEEGFMFWQGTRYFGPVTSWFGGWVSPAVNMQMNSLLGVQRSLWVKLCDNSVSD